MRNIPPLEFNAHYCENCCGAKYERNQQWLDFFDKIAEHIVMEIHPATSLDAGCAMGFLVESLRKHGVKSFGIDISEYAIQKVHPDIRPYCRVGTVSEPFHQRYDLITCIEVLEHLPSSEAEKAIANFCEHSDQILFSSTPEDFKEATHLNVQPIEYWAKLFARYGFFHDLEYDASYVTYWTILFRRNEIKIEETIPQYERKFYRLWKENKDLRLNALEHRREIAKYYEDTQILHETETEIRKQLFVKNHEIEELRNLAISKQQDISSLTERNRDLRSELFESEKQRDILISLVQEIKNSRGWQLVEKLRGTWIYSIYMKLITKRRS